MRLFEGFLDNMNYDQTVLPDKSILNRPKVSGKCQNSEVQMGQFEEFSNNVELFLDVMRLF